jgi:hypothetical protein
MSRFTGYYTEYVTGSGSLGSGGSFTGGEMPGAGSGSGSGSEFHHMTAGSGSMSGSGSGSPQLSGIQSGARFLILIGLIIVGIIAIFSLFKDAPIMQTIKRGAKAAATSGMSELTQ